MKIWEESDKIQRAKMMAALQEAAKEEARKIGGWPSQPNEENLSSNVPDRHPFLGHDNPHLVNATEEDKITWLSIPRATNSREVPRTAGVVKLSWNVICEGQDRRYYGKIPDYCLEGKSLTPNHDQVGDASRGSEDGNGGGGDDPDGDGAPMGDDYGDWGRDFYDEYEEGPSDSWQPDIGGGFRKPGGGYYDLASVLEEKMAKISLK